MLKTDPSSLRDRGYRLFTRGCFREACAYFAAALSQISLRDDLSLYLDTSYWWARSLQCRGEHDKALELLHALMRTDGRRFLRYRHAIATSHFKTGSYSKALRGFESIVTRYEKCRKDHWYYASQLGLACCHAYLKEYRRSLTILSRLVEEHQAGRATYLKEIENIRSMLRDELDARRSLHASRAALPPSETPEELRLEGDPQLCQLVRELLPAFPEIRRPIKAIYIEAAENNPEGLRRMAIRGQFIPIAQGQRTPSGHLIAYNREVWREANDSELRGNLAHELMHRAWDDAGADGLFFNWSRDTLSYACIERIVDLCVVAKGFASELRDSKRYLQRALDRQESLDLGVADIDAILRIASQFELAGSDSSPMKFQKPQGL